MSTTSRALEAGFSLAIQGPDVITPEQLTVEAQTPVVIAGRKLFQGFTRNEHYEEHGICTSIDSHCRSLEIVLWS